MMKGQVDFRIQVFSGLNEAPRFFISVAAGRWLLSLLPCLPSLEAVILTLLVGLLAMASLFGMHLDMTWNTQSLQVVAMHIEAQSLHLLNGVCRLHRHLVMHIDSRAHMSIQLAPLTQRMLTQVLLSQQLPPLRVQQPLVSLVAAHTTIPQ